MGKKDPRIDVYIAKAAPFAQPILKHIRKQMHASCPEVEETMKWSMPHFEYQGLLGGMAAFKEHCAFGFWKTTLVIPNVDKSAMGQFGCLTKLSDLPSDKIFSGYIKKAAQLNADGVKIAKKATPKVKTALKPPPYF